MHAADELVYIVVSYRIVYYRKLEISTVGLPTKTTYREPAYSQALNEKKIGRPRVKIQGFRLCQTKCSVEFEVFI